MEETKRIDEGPETQKRTPANTVVVVGAGLLSIAVLCFPSILPDFIPVLGALDEVAATTVLISCLAYFGVDFGALFGNIGSGKKAEKSADDDIIDV